MRTFEANPVTIERSRDYALLWRISVDPHIYRVTSDDFSPRPNQWKVAQREDLIYLLAREDSQVLGFCAFIPVNGVTFESHLCFLQCAYGPKAAAAFEQMLRWMWAGTRAERICGAVPDYNRRAIKFSERAGFEQYGRNLACWMKNGRLHDMVLRGISRPKANL